MTNSRRNDVRDYNAALSAREVWLLSGLERDRATSLSIADARRRLGPSAQRVLSSLSRKGALQRVSRGLYLVRPFRTLTRASVSSTVVAAAVLLGQRPHYFGGLWACAFHQLTAQTYGAVIDAFVATRLASRPLGSGRLVFHLVPAARLREGVTTATLEGTLVRVSTLERTLLDALDSPRASGGVENAVRLVSGNLSKANARQLIDQAARLASSATIQRLGVLLERTALPDRALAPLKRRVNASLPLTAMLPARPRRGPINPRWRLIENDR